MDDLPPTTAPLDLTASARGYATEDDARAIGSNVLGLIQHFGCYMNLETLNGVTLAYDYAEALSELDRGVETTSRLTASKHWAMGVTMTPTVLRDGALKSHMLFNAAILEGLLDDPASLSCREAVHIIAHECAHVEINAVKDRQFPNVILRYRAETWFEALQLEVIEASWDEYAACRISAGFGADPSENYRGVFINILEEAGANVREAILRYRHDGDLDVLVVEAQRNIGSLVKYASYVLGTADGLAQDIEADLREISEALNGHWFRPYFLRLRDAHRALWDRYGKWEHLQEFETIAEVWLEMMADRSLEVTPQDDGGMYVNVPFRPETSSYQALIWGLRQSTKDYGSWPIPKGTGGKPSDGA